MLFNGHTQKTIDEIDESTFLEIMVMYSDGIIGNKKVIDVLGTLVTGVFNYIRAPNSSPYNLKSVINEVYGYLYKETQQSASDSLLAYMSQAQGFDLKKFKR